MSAPEIASLERDAAILDLIGQLDRLDTRRGEQIAELHAELAEIRDGMVALSNRIESVQRGSRAVRDELLAHQTDTDFAHRA